MPGTPGTPHAARLVSDEPSPRRLLSSRTVYEGRIWDVVSDSFQLNDDGDPLVRDYIEHPGAVAVLPMNDDGEVLLIKQYRHPVGMDLWEIPAGLLDVEGEDFVVGAARELAEEADLIAGKWNVLADFFNSPGSSSEAIRIYLARGLSHADRGDFELRAEEAAPDMYSAIDLVSEKLARVIPHSIPLRTSLASSLKRRSDAMPPS